MQLKNQYYIMRHGEAISNVKQIMTSWPETFDNPLTPHGVDMVKKSADCLKTKNIDMIFASDLKRTTQTAEIVADALSLKVQFDERLREISFGSMNGESVDEISKMFGRYEGLGYGQFGGEDYKDVSKRMYEFLEHLENSYGGKIILLVSHQAPLTLLDEKVHGIPLLQITKTPEYIQIQRAEVRDLNREVTAPKLSPIQNAI